MSIDPSTSGNGLLSKVVKFVANPTTHWSDLDQPASTQSESDLESRQMLRDMLERKRQNDFVRNREFNELRRLRRQKSATAAPAAGAAPAAEPMVVAPNSSQWRNADERARTLKKINEIEAQMATSAWGAKGRQRTTPGVDSVVMRPTAVPTDARQTEREFAPTQPLLGAQNPAEPLPWQRPTGSLPTRPMTQLPPTMPAVPTAASATQPLTGVQGVEMVDSSGITGPMTGIGVVTGMAGMSGFTGFNAGSGSGSLSSPVPVAPVAPAIPTAPPPPPPPLAAAPVVAFEGTDEFQVEVLAEARQNPEVEEAAIRFANGDADGAEQGLLAVLVEGGSQREDVDTWLTLFDLYRASGEREKFDEIGGAFAAHFGRSAPQWMRASDDGASAVSKKTEAPKIELAGLAHWTCPSRLGTQSLATLNASIARAAPPWHIDWRYAKEIDPITLPALTEIFNRWAGTEGRFKFLGVENMLRILADNSPNEVRETDPQWWKARLALLRVLDDMDEFEMVALNYCITYEVSPPPWMPPTCSYGPMDEEGNTLMGALSGMGGSTVSSSLGTSRAPFQDTTSSGPPTRMPDEDGVIHAELDGELLGSAADFVAPLTPPAAPTTFAIDCRHLQRVDFGAAGDLLNWAMTLHSGGHSVTFQQVNRIVAAFFGVVGLNQAARITLRRD